MTDWHWSYWSINMSVGTSALASGVPNPSGNVEFSSNEMEIHLICLHSVVSEDWLLFVSHLHTRWKAFGIYEVTKQTRRHDFYCPLLDIILIWIIIVRALYNYI